jgi:hypothetical protein
MPSHGLLKCLCIRLGQTVESGGGTNTGEDRQGLDLADNTEELQGQLTSSRSLVCLAEIR